MREIKFRAWDKELKKWIEWETVSECAIGALIDDERFELVQHTGLKDKNGVDIYEGDIVSGESHQSAIRRQLTDQNDITGENNYGIRFERGSFRLYDLKTNSWVAVIDHHVISQKENLKVIGNIYDNPELLEELG